MQVSRPDSVARNSVISFGSRNNLCLGVHDQLSFHPEDFSNCASGKPYTIACCRSDRKNVQRLSSDILRRVGYGGRQSTRSFSSLPSNEQRLAGQVAVITGGASGIGAATARLFTDHGARVVIADINPSLGEKLLKELGPQAEYVQCDVRKEEDIENAVKKAYSLENRLDIFYSNAGIIGCVGPIDELRVDEYDDTIAVDLRSAVIGIKHAVRVMKPQKKGSIVVTGSVASVLGGMGPHGYTVAKAGLVGLVKSCAAELGRHNIRVNMISPELVPTPLSAHAISSMAAATMTVDDIKQMVAANSVFPNRSLNEVDIANAALYLASDMGGYVSGHNLVVDGGKTVTQVLAAGGNTWFTQYIPLIGENGRRGL